MKTQTTNQTLDKNPFDTYREPTTGRWVIVYPECNDRQKGPLRKIASKTS